MQAGSLWLGETKDKKIPYLGGHIETPAVPSGKIYIKLFKPEPKFEGEKITWLYDVIWSSDSNRENTQSASEHQYQGLNVSCPVEVYDAEGNIIVIDDDSMPF